MGKKIALGAAAPGHAAVVAEPHTLEEKVAALTERLDQLTAAFHIMHSSKVKDRRRSNVVAEFGDLLDSTTNKDGLPLGMSLMGRSHRGGVHFLIVEEGGYKLGSKTFDSLSAAAEASSGVRRSGWTFWKLPDGRNVKEVFGKR